MCKSYFGTFNFEHLLLSSLILNTFYCRLWCHIVWHSLHQLSWFCPLPSSCASPITHWQGKTRGWKVLGLHYGMLAIRWFINNIMIIKNPNHTTIQTMLKKINSIPAKANAVMKASTVVTFSNKKTFSFYSLIINLT